MKKSLISLTAALLLFSSSQAAVFADSIVYDDDEDITQNLYVSTEVLDTVSFIDLNYVLDKALKDSHNLNLLTLKYAAQAGKQGDLEDQKERLVGTAVPAPQYLPTTPGQVVIPGVDPLDPMTAISNTAINKLMDSMGALAGGMNTIILTQREQARMAIHQLDTDKKNTLLQTDEAKAGIRLQTIAQYVQLLGQKKQLDFMKEYESVMEKDLLKATLFQQQGLASADDVQTVQKAISKQKDDIASLTNNYRLGIVQLSADIGISYDPNLIIRDIEPIVVEPIVEKDTKTLLESSYQMKTTANNIDESVWQSGNTVTNSTYGSEYLGANIAIAGQKNQQTQLELTKKIQAAYNDAKNAYQSVLTEQRNLNDINADLKNVQFRYNVGVISKHDLTKFMLKVHQNETTLAAAKLKYYTLKEKVKAMDTGFIQ
ncbi:TolC family protein [Paenibacillus sp. SI8]|uniref:TolC family protein n=1 Tax=unclassified Paenibacillus TaxID=185978 RepID=UPI003465CCD7